MYAEVCLPFFIDRTFTYLVPTERAEKIVVGSIVSIKFKNNICNGIVVSFSNTVLFKGKLNLILAIDSKNNVPMELWKTLVWMEQYYITPIGKIAQLALSWLFKKTKQKPRYIKSLSLNTNSNTLSFYKKSIDLFTPNQKKLIDLLITDFPEPISLVLLKSKIKSIYSIKKILLDKKYLVELNNLEKDINVINIRKNIDSLELTKVQNTIYRKIKNTKINEWKPHLIQGIPGSGKTEIYLKLTDFFFKQQKSCLILVPEIALSSEIFDRFQIYFGSKVLTWHSKASEAYKRSVWDKINSKNPYIIIGARSAVFTPLNNLGLIIIDEEHDSSYKESERQPTYNARNIAIIRSKFSNSTVVLGSATPSLDSYYNAIMGKYYMYKINERYGASILPSIELINMNNDKNSFINKPIFSNYLIKEINDKLNCDEQILILHNRRGFSALKDIQNEDKILKCKNCDVILTFHKKNNELICHHCYTKTPISSINNYSESTNLQQVGFGTEQLEDMLKTLFPNKKILRMDADSANTIKKQKEILAVFKSGKANILLGTQMIAKGLDFKNITLVVVINADIGLMIPDFKSHEKVFQLIYQVVGRAGRSEKKGKAIIQTYQPDSNTIQMATNYDLEKFYNLQLDTRKSLNYPPFVRLIRLVFKGKNESYCKFSADKIFRLLQKKFNNIMIGPLPCPIIRLSNNYRYHIILKAPHSQFKVVLKSIKNLKIQKKSLVYKGISLLIDIDSDSVL